MKKIVLYGLSALMVQAAIAQSSKQVQWAYAAKKIADKTYEVHMTATINGDYHLYAQDAGGEGPVATSFNFVKTPLLVLDGQVKESGKLIKKFESAWSHDVKYYEKNVDFIQTVKIKGNAKTNLSGKVEFMVCNDRQCLPPSAVDIKISVGG
ncbi:MAG TPA: protein-disulfide reductase DsbD domain-containing protein [Puia sp.]|nr:protein-disulfide reductase DsbD domain-containing protein [Puia sp.]